MALEYNRKLTPRAQELRKNRTPEENLLWYHFLCHYPVRFRRQHPIGNFIVDFYCHKAKLVVELDGSQHYSAEGMEYDAERDAYLHGLGLQVMRFSNRDVMQRFENVCEAIDQTVKKSFPRGEGGSP